MSHRITCLSELVYYFECTCIYSLSPMFYVIDCNYVCCFLYVLVFSTFALLRTCAPDQEFLNKKFWKSWTIIFIHWTQKKRPRNITLEIHVMAWDRRKNVAGYLYKLFTCMKQSLVSCRVVSHGLRWSCISLWDRHTKVAGYLFKLFYCKAYF